MVRTLTTTLAAALGENTRVPVVSATVEDHIIRYDTVPAANTALTQNFFSACVANDGSIIRVLAPYAATFTSFQYQRITNPTIASQWTTWTTFAGSSGLINAHAAVYVSNNGGTLRAFVQRGSGGTMLWCWTSTDNGVTWSASPTTVGTPPSSATIKGLSSAGNNDIFLQYDVVGGAAMGAYFFAGSWGALVTWPLTPTSGGAGLAVYWDSASSLYRIIYSTGYEIWTINYTPSGSVWSGNGRLVPATPGGLAHLSPFVTRESNGVYTLTYIDNDAAGITGLNYAYPRVRQSADFIHWNNGTVLQEANFNAGFGLALVNRPGDALYLIGCNLAYKRSTYSQSDATRYLDISGAILNYQREERVGQAARIEIELDNASGVLNTKVGSPTSFQPLNIGSSLLISEGYKTGAGHTTPETVQTTTLRIRQVVFERAPGRNRVHVIAYDTTRLLDMLNSYQTVYQGASISFLLKEICARAGLLSVNIPGTSSFTQTIPFFILQASRPLRTALEEVMQTYNLTYFLDQSETVQFRELSSGDPSVWSYQPEIETLSLGSDDERGERDEPANRIVVIGSAPSNTVVGQVTTGEAYDNTRMKLTGVERIGRVVDLKLTSAAQCAVRAQSLLYREQRGTVRHSVTVPLNPALQLYDSITLTDYNAPLGTDRAGTFRVKTLNAHYSAQDATFRHTIELEGL
ncbi:hypothetical protein [Ktedonospora formicarum]|uniref:Uncharacterized protein n=1 Tax=Ktedonospora formicarum TaxID=2778364 RepID=A0A8J3MYG0_9CHLR|nr:hypothetical protein [Ktedonospora formicarum]GHO49610.1 hypothetical protein KSX_77730 [Ktedonospora formicarum]